MTDKTSGNMNLKDSTAHSRETSPKLTSSQQRVRQGLQLVFYAIAAFALILIMRLVMAGSGWVNTADQLVRVAATVAFVLSHMPSRR